MSTEVTKVLLGSPLDVQNTVNTCQAVSKECTRGLLQLASSEKLQVEYGKFFHENEKCVSHSFAPCWDKTHRHWKSNICSIDCSNRVDSLESTCVEVNGTLCEWELQVGLGGTSIDVQEPLCVPQLCSEQDLQLLNECLMSHTCGGVPEEVLPLCNSRLGPKEEGIGKLLISIAFSTICALVLGLFVVVKVVNARRRSRVEAGSNLQEPLVQGEFGIVEGTPRLIDGDRMSRNFATPDIFFGQTGEAENHSSSSVEQTANSTKKFKLNDELEAHVVDAMREADAKGPQEASLVWHNVWFRRNKVDILRGLTGMIKPGTAMAVIGAPDSGATTFLKLLAGRAQGGKSWGDILIDGMPPDHLTHRKVGYIPKEDFNLPTLTVRETLAFSLALRSDASMTEKLKKERIDATLQLLGLTHVADTVVGDQLIRGCSGGEKRRVSIGVEAIVGRKIQIMDCVTNGLDSAAAYEVIKTSRVLADTGLNCSIATVRQPSPELLGLFHKVMLISRGSCVYFGPTNQVESYFTGLGFARPLTKSLPDFLEELTDDASRFTSDPQDLAGTFTSTGSSASSSSNSGATATSTGSDSATSNKDNGTLRYRPIKRVKSRLRLNLVDAYKESELYKNLAQRIWNEMDRLASARRPRRLGATLQENADEDEEDWAYEDAEDLFSKAKYFVRWLYRAFRTKIMHDDRYETRFREQLWVCLSRQVKITARSPTVKAKLFRALFQGILLGTMFYQLALDQRDARNRFGLLFIVVTSVSMGAMAVIPQLFNQRIIFYHQSAAGYFRPLAYLTSVILCEVPLFFMEALIFVSLAYPLCGLNGGLFSENWLYFVLTHAALNFASFSLCLLGVMAAPTATVATASIPTIMSLFILFSGYLVRREKLPFPWINDASMITRPFKGLSLNEMDGLIFRCDPDELIPPVGYENATVPPPYGFWGPEYRTCPIGSGHLALRLYSLQDGEQDKWKLLTESLWFIVVYVVLLAIVMTSVSYAPDSSDSAETAMRNARRVHRLKLRAKSRVDLARLESDIGEREAEYLNGNISSPTGVLSPLTSPGSSSHGAGSVEFENLNYSVFLNQGPCRKKKRLQLLHNISGHVQGKILALMGPSGSGKSTLLDVLAMRKTGGQVEFEKLLVSGKPRDRFFPRIAGYVEQMDSHLPTTTVYEAIWMSAELRLPSSISKADRKRRVAEVIKCLALQPFVEEKIGTPDEGGVSPEVRKKVTIAVELVFDSEVLFLDEPTTGLDGKSALNIMQAIRKTCAKKSTICTIHQPSAEVFALFDWMLLLQKGGRVCYFGPVPEMIPYFEMQGFGSCGADKNPADFALECSNRSIDGQDAASLYDVSDLKQKMLALAPSRLAGAEIASDHHTFTHVYAAPYHLQFKYQLLSQLAYQYRDQTLLFTRCFTAILFGLIIGGIFFHMDRSQASAESRVGLIFIGLVYSGYTAILTIPKSIDQRPVRFREYKSNYYAMWVHYLGVFLGEVPFFCLQVGLYVVTFYFLVGLRGGHHFFYFFGAVILHAFATFGYSSFISMIAPNADTATIINTVSNGTMTLLCGFLLPFKSIPSFWRIFYYLSFYRFPLGSLVTNEMLDAKFNCGPHNNETALPIFVGGLNRETPPPPFGLGAPNTTCYANLARDYTEVLQNPYCFKYFCPIVDGSFLLDRFSFPKTVEQMNHNLIVLAAFAVAFRVLAYIAVSKIQHIQR